MTLASSDRLARAPHGPALLLLSLAVMGCPGPEPATTSGEGGGGGSTSVGSTSVSSSDTTVVSSGETTGAGGAPGVGGAGGDGSTSSVGGSAPAGTGGHGGGAGGCGADLENDPENCGACGRACSELEAEQLTCANGRCKPACRDGFSSVTAPDAPEDDDGCETAWRRVFVTAEPESLPLVSAAGELAGAEAADAICQGLAGNLGGSWKAWISDGLSPSPSERFTRHEVPYWLLDGTVIATGFDDVIDGALDAPIHVTEAGESLFGDVDRDSFPVWTATDELGEATPQNCSNWAPVNQAEQVVQVGVVADYDAGGLEPSAWTAFPQPVGCFQEDVRLYCFEQ